MTLADYQPTMWRQIILGGDARLDTLCYLVLASFRAQGSHLFTLQDGVHTYQLPIFESGLGANKSLLAHWLGEYRAGAELTLAYDFGDGWRFKIKVDEVADQSRLKTNSTAKLVAGSGRGIIDDIGGTTGLTDVAKDDPGIDHPLNVNREQAAWRKRVDRLKKNYR